MCYVYGMYCVLNCRHSQYVHILWNETSPCDSGEAHFNWIFISRTGDSIWFSHSIPFNFIRTFSWPMCLCTYHYAICVHSRYIKCQSFVLFLLTTIIPISSQNSMYLLEFSVVWTSRKYSFNFKIYPLLV